MIWLIEKTHTSVDPSSCQDSCRLRLRNLTFATLKKISSEAKGKDYSKDIKDDHPYIYIAISYAKALKLGFQTPPITDPCETQIPTGPLHQLDLESEEMGSVLQQGSVHIVGARSPTTGLSQAHVSRLLHFRSFPPDMPNHPNQESCYKVQSISIKSTNVSSCFITVHRFSAGHLGFQVASYIETRAEVGVIQMRQHLRGWGMDRDAQVGFLLIQDI